MFAKAILTHAAAFAALLASVHTLPTPESLPAPSLDERALSYDFNSGGIKGVNLGGWFVLEPWITPSLFNVNGAVDEYTLTQALGKNEAFNRLNNHWNTWITEADFQAIARAGLNFVRIPIGYWAISPLNGEPYVQGQIPYLDKAIGWARNAGLKILIDLHGAPGSQNGFDNSGRKGAITWTQGSTTQQTLNAIRALAVRYANQADVVPAIELLNEPLGPVLNMGTVKQFYYDGWGTIRDSNKDTVVTIHDAFMDVQSFWNGFMNYQSGVNDVMLDTHQYQIFDQGSVSQSPSQHVQSACNIGPRVRGTDKWTVVGEWTGAQTDCAKWLNGLGVGARYDGTYPGSSYVGSCAGKYTGTSAGLSSDDKKNIRSFIEAQLDAYSQHTGWFFWTWKTESAPEWDMQQLLGAGLFPQPLSARQYPNQCHY